ALIQPPSKRNQKARAPANQMATTHGRSGSGNARGTTLRIAGAAATSRAKVEAAAVRGAETVTGTGATGFFRLQVISGAAAIPASAAHASKHRAFGVEKPAIHLRTA